MAGSLVVAWLTLAASVGAAATLEAAASAGFGRLAIDWPTPVELTTTSAGALFEVAASEPFPSELSTVVADLAPLLDSATLEAGGRILRLRPAPGVVVEAVVLDERALRIGLTASDAPLLGLRLGRHDGFRRVVLEPVDADSRALTRESGRLIVRLPGRLTANDRERLARVPGVGAVAAAANELFLTLEPGSSVRDLFVEPDRQVLDISVANRSLPAAAAADRRASNTATSNTATFNTATSNTATSNTATPDTATLDAAARREPSLAPGVVPRQRPARSATPAPPGLVATDSAPAALGQDGRVAAAALAIDALATSDRTVELQFAWPEPVAAAVFVRGTQLWVAFAAESPSIEIDADAFTPIARRFVRAVRQVPHEDATVFQLTLHNAVVGNVRREAGQWRIGLAAAQGVSELPPRAAAPLGQATASGLWLPGIEAVIALDDPVVGDRLEVGLASMPTGPQATAQRFLGLRLLPSLQGTVWRRLIEPDRVPVAVADGVSLGPRDGVVRAAAGDVPAPIALLETLPIALDPVAAEPPGDEPAAQGAAAQGAAAQGAAAQGAAAQGAAGRAALGPEPLPALPLAAPSDRASAAATAADQVSPTTSTAALQAATTASADGSAVAPARPSPLGLARSAETLQRPYWEQRAALLQAAERADGTARAALQLDLARLMIAHGLGAEAVSWLASLPPPRRLAAADDDLAEASRAALEGAARVLAGRHAEALARLADPALADDDETALWRAAARAALEDWDAALVDWRRGRVLLAGYPPALQGALGEPGVLLLLQTGQIDDAFALLEQLGKLPLRRERRDRLQWLEAMALERDGALDAARVIWRRLADGGIGAYRSPARRALVDSDLAAGRISGAEAVERLAADSLHWRGLPQEIDLWRRLAALQHATGESEAALSTLQAAVARGSQTRSAGAIAAEMAGIVDDLFAELAAGRRSATAMLLTYRRFAELLRPGSAGDAQVKLLASRLAEIGLERPAIELLRDRLQQSDRRDPGRAALGLALARRLAKTGDRPGAIAALLDSTPLDAIDPQLATARRELLVELGQGEDPAGARDPAASPDHQLEQLRDRTRAAFDRADWAEVAAAAAPLERWLPAAGALAGPTAELLLMVATAGRQLADDALVDHLAERYGRRLSAADDQALLGLLASRARLAGTPAELLSDAADHTRRLRSAVEGEPSR